MQLHYLLLLVLNIALVSSLNTRSYYSRRQTNRVNELLGDLNIHPKRFSLNEARNGKMIVTNLDSLRAFVVMGRHLSLWSSLNNKQQLYRQNRARGKMQRQFSPDEHFPCHNLTHARSSTPPSSVHRLHPGDIDVIASLGDSLSAGNGIISESILHIANEYRGISFAGGGYGSWRTFLTLPNILKVFNPKLYGFSTSIGGLVVDSTSRLNIAEPMILWSDMPFQASVIVDRMRNDPRIDMQHHWKLLTIFTGNNDLCSDICHHDVVEEVLQRHEANVRRTLRILRDNVPRLLVNLLPAPNVVTALKSMQNIPLQCTAVHLVGCHCIFSELISAQQLRQISRFIERWQQIEQRIAMLPEFNTEDFAVVYQPFIANMSAPKLTNGDTDLRYFASDCFHFSQLGHAAMANSLWNNMLQPVGAKLKFSPPFQHFECPTADQPYIATLRNG